MKRILLIMSQPPGCSGVQGLIYSKLLPYLEARGWEFHFAGPSPELVSVLLEPANLPAERLHYTRKVSPSRRFSILKNRYKRGTLAFFFFGILQLASRWLERIASHDEAAYLRRGLSEVVQAAEQRWNFDLIAGKSPDFSTLELSGSLTARLRKPFVAMVVDPYGYRDGPVFRPAEPQKQKALLDQCCGAMFMSPMTRGFYIEADLVSSEKAWAFTDSYPMDDSLYQSGRSGLSPSPALRLVHLGMLPEWRPVEPFLEALEAFDRLSTTASTGFTVHIFGYLYPAAQRQIQASSYLDKIVKVSKSVPYAMSHWLAEDADVQLVVIGPRHLDNQPSKFFEYLGHGKPVLVLGPPGNPIEAIVQELGIGVYADVSSCAEILRALQSLAQNYDSFRSAFLNRRQDIQRYSAPRVAENWCNILDAMEAYSKFCPPTIVSGTGDPVFRTGGQVG
jgi:hypothetical protein